MSSFLTVFIHPVTCLLIVLSLFFLEISPPYRQLVQHTPFLLHFFRWLIFFFLGLPVILVYQRYRKERTNRMTQTSEHQLEIISVLDEILSDKEPAVEYHTKRVATLVRRLCETMHLDQEQTRVIVFAALFHDIGKLFLDKSIILNHGELTGDEKTEYEKHPLFSQRILHQIKAYPGAGLLALHHHEYWDGKGFPESLAGEDIPLGSRIIHVADAYDSYKNGLHSLEHLTHEQTMAKIRKLSGSSFDPKVVSLFDKMMMQMPDRA